MAESSFLGQGIKFPYEVDKFGRIALSSDVEKIVQSLQTLFAEPTGTELMREEYGSDIRLALFEPNDTIVRGLLDYFIVKAIGQWETRIKVIDIVYSTPIDKPDTIQCSVFCIVKQTSETFSFIFPFIRELKI
jgi:phage baseplate assembly protein W